MGIGFRAARFLDDLAPYSGGRRNLGHSLAARTVAYSPCTQYSGLGRTRLRRARRTTLPAVGKRLETVGGRRKSADGGGPPNNGMKLTREPGHGMTGAASSACSLTQCWTGIPEEEP